MGPIAWVQSRRALDIQAAPQFYTNSPKVFAVSMQLGSACSNICRWLFAVPTKPIYKNIINYKATNIPPPAQHFTQLLPKSRGAESFCHQSVTSVTSHCPRFHFDWPKAAGQSLRELELQDVWPRIIGCLRLAKLHCYVLPHSCEFIHHTYQSIYSIL